MQVAVIGEGERAAARVAWYRRLGVTVLPVAVAAVAVPEADLYDLCAAATDAPPVLGALLRRRRAAFVLSPALIAQPAAAARLARALARRRCSAALVGGWRFVPAFARLRELASSGVLGAVRSVRVDVSAAPGELAEALPAALDLGAWLAGEGVAEPESASANALRLVVGGTHVEVVLDSAAEAAEPRWSVTVDAELGQAVGAACFRPGLPGQRCGPQSAQVTLAGRVRPIALPSADPAGGELAAMLARQRAGLPWLAVCGGPRLLALLALAGTLAGKVAEEHVHPG